MTEQINKMKRSRKGIRNREILTYSHVQESHGSTKLKGLQDKKKEEKVNTIINNSEDND